MTATTVDGDGRDPSAALADLIRVLQQDAEQRAELVELVNRLLTADTGPRAQGSEEGSQVCNLRQQIERESNRNIRARWYAVVLGLFAVIIGIVLFYLVFTMARNMNRMEDYVYNMGHAPGDERKRALDLKDRGPSYMFTMAHDMSAMLDDMTQMRETIVSMGGDMRQMRISMIKMDDNIGGMAGNMSTMSQDMTVMNGTMGRMQYDTLLMRQGVGGMASDTNAMGAPFRAMNSVMPW